jgi:sec-independent protein translocase protein TatA
MTLLFLENIGGSEVFFILMVVLMLFGSKSIPGIAKTLGKGMREIKTATNEIKRDIQNSTLEMRKDLNVENPLTEMKKMMDQPIEPKEFKKDNPETTLEAPEESLPISTTAKPTEKIETPETTDDKV